MLVINDNCHFQGNPNLYSCVLLGDDNFLNVAEFDLKFQRTPNMRIRQSGHCVSGLTIADATKRVLDMDNELIKTAIVNVGSVDISQGRELIQMIDDFMQLVAAFEHVEIVPIFTTLAPLPNYMQGNKNDILKDFNHFLRVNVVSNYCIIDLNKCMKRPEGVVNMNLYQKFPRFCSGSRKPLVVWNKFGRTRILGMIIKNLGAAIIYKNGYVGDYF